MNFARAAAPETYLVTMMNAKSDSSSAAKHQPTSLGPCFRPGWCRREHVSGAAHSVDQRSGASSFFLRRLTCTSSDLSYGVDAR